MQLHMGDDALTTSAMHAPEMLKQLAPSEFDATMQLLKENGVSEQDIHLRAAQLHPLDMSAGPMVAPGVAPDEF